MGEVDVEAPQSSGSSAGVHVFGSPSLTPGMDVGDLPAKAQKLLTDGNILFGNDNVCPIEPYRIAHMQAACVIDAQ